MEVIELDQAAIAAYVSQWTVDSNWGRNNGRTGDMKRNEFQVIVDKHPDKSRIYFNNIK